MMAKPAKLLLRVATWPLRILINEARRRVRPSAQPTGSAGRRPTATPPTPTPQPETSFEHPGHSNEATTARRPSVEPPTSEPVLDDQFLSTKAFASELGVSDQTIRNRLREGLIYGRRSGRGYTFPRAQLIAPQRRGRPARVVPGLDVVLRSFGDRDEAWCWLTTPNTAIADATGARRSPIQELQTGTPENVQAILPTNAGVGAV